MSRIAEDFLKISISVQFCNRRSDRGGKMVRAHAHYRGRGLRLCRRRQKVRGEHQTGLAQVADQGEPSLVERVISTTQHDHDTHLSYACPLPKAVLPADVMETPGEWKSVHTRNVVFHNLPKLPPKTTTRALRNFANFTHEQVL